MVSSVLRTCRKKKETKWRGEGRRQKFAWERAPCGGPAAGPCFCLPAGLRQLHAVGCMIQDLFSAPPPGAGREEDEDKRRRKPAPAGNEICMLRAAAAAPTRNDQFFLASRLAHRHAETSNYSPATNACSTVRQQLRLTSSRVLYAITTSPSSTQDKLQRPNLFLARPRLLVYISI